MADNNVSIAAKTIPWYSPITTVEVWIYATQPFVTEAGTPINTGSPTDGLTANQPLRKIACTIDGSAHTCAIAAATLTSTEDAQVNNTVTYIAVFVNTATNRVINGYSVFGGAGAFRLPTDTPTTWAEIAAYNVGELASSIPRDVHVTGDLLVDGFYQGNGSQLTGIGSAGGVVNPGSTTIGADSDVSGGGVIAFQTRTLDRVLINNDGSVTFNNKISVAVLTGSDIAIQGTSDSSAGVRGDSVSSVGVRANSDSGTGLSSSSTSGIGVQSTSDSGNAFDGGTVSGTGLNVSSRNGGGGIIEISGAQTSHNASNVLLVQRRSSGAFNATGDILGVFENSTVSGTKSGALLRCGAGGNSSLFTVELDGKVTNLAPDVVSSAGQGANQHEITSTAGTVVENVVGGTDETFDNDYEAFSFNSGLTPYAGAVRVQLKKDSGVTPLSYVNARIYTDVAGAPGVQVVGADNKIYASGLSDAGYTDVEFAVQTAVLSASTTYWVVMFKSVSGGNIYINRTTGTNRYAISSDAVTWTAQNGKLPYFRVLGLTNIGLKATSTNTIGVGGYSTNSAGVRGTSVNHFGVRAESVNAPGTYSTSVNEAGAQAQSTHGQGILASSVSGVGAQAFSNNAGAGLLEIAGAQTANNSSSVLLLQRRSSGAFDATGDLLKIVDNPTVSGTISGNLLSATVGATEIFKVARTGDAYIGLAQTNPQIFLGGTTSAFPVFRRNGTEVRVQLADLSAYAPIRAAGYAEGLNTMNLTGGGLSGANTFLIRWSSDGTYFGTYDAGIKRGSPNVVKLTDGSTGAAAINILGVAGAVSDASFSSAPADNTIALDTTNFKIYVRFGGVWKSTAALT